MSDRSISFKFTTLDRHFPVPVTAVALYPLNRNTTALFYIRNK